MQPQPSGFPANSATLGGTIQSPTYDPYSTPGIITTQPGALTVNPYGAYADPHCQPYAVGQPPRRLIEQVRLQHEWLGGDDELDLDINSTEFNASFAFPLLPNQNPIFVTPGMIINVLDGPDTAFAAGADLPGQTYSPYLETSWQPQVTDWFSADLAFRIGVYSDFEESVDADSLRYTGRALGVVNLSQQWQLAAGVLYYDRLRVKVLPAGGLIWTPSADSRWEILFPRPKISQRLFSWGNSDIWGFVGAEYGGGQWRIEREFLGFEDDVNYNDIRASLGLEWINCNGTHGLIEGGYVFERELLYRSGLPAEVEPDETFFLRAGVTF